MIYLKLFITFLQIGSVSFGGGYSILKVISHYVVDLNKWLTTDQFNDIVAISQSTPGPIGINAATFVGYKMGGVLGALITTVSVILVPITLSLVVYLFYIKHKENEKIKTIISKLKPVIIAMICSASLSFLKDAFGSFASILITIVSTVLLMYSKVDTVVLLLISGIIGLIVFR